MDAKRIFLIVCDSMGVGELPDADKFGDVGSNTMASICRSDKFHAPMLRKMGLFNIDGIGCGESTDAPIGAYGKAAELSGAKDTVTGHREIMGIVSERGAPVYPNGFPTDVLDRITAATGIGWLCNKPYSGTDVIRDFGEEMMRTGRVIVYTSADSVFQVAAHEDVIPREKLYSYCEKAREILVGENAVERVIARPFVGRAPNFERTPGRHDYALAPEKETVLNRLERAGLDVISVGKISDIFAGSGITRGCRIDSNADGMKKTDMVAASDFRGLCFVNLVDFDMKYGHRNDVDGYAAAVSEFDAWLERFIPSMRDDDVLIVTADHGCDPATPSTDHSREYIPILVYGKMIRPVNLGVMSTFADLGKTVQEMLGVYGGDVGHSFREMLLYGVRGDKLVSAACEAAENSYSPYSTYRVGAALLSRSGKIYTGCNVENAAFPSTCCAERVALFNAISSGERDFDSIAIAGGRHGEKLGEAYPCGTCRQVLSEFCGSDFKITVGTEGNTVSLGELLPHSFGKSNL